MLIKIVWTKLGSCYQNEETISHFFTWRVALTLKPQLTEWMSKMEDSSLPIEAIKWIMLMIQQNPTIYH